LCQKQMILVGNDKQIIGTTGLPTCNGLLE
jgi:hypothetical protein